MHTRYPAPVPKNIQIRNVNDETYATLRRRADAEDLSLSAYARRMLDREASGPTMAELLDQADRDRAGWAGVDTATIVRTVREIRDNDGRDDD